MYITPLVFLITTFTGFQFDTASLGSTQVDPAAERQALTTVEYIIVLTAPETTPVELFTPLETPPPAVETTERDAQLLSALTDAMSGF